MVLFLKTIHMKTSTKTHAKTTNLQVSDVVITTTGDITTDDSSSGEKPMISVHFADKLIQSSRKRTWFYQIFDFLRPNQNDRIELRSFCKLFRDILPPPSQVWTQFPHSEHTTWESLIDAVNSSWKKDMKKAPTLIVVRRRGVVRGVQNNHDEMVEEEKEEEKEGEKEEEKDDEQPEKESPENVKQVEGDNELPLDGSQSD